MALLQQDGSLVTAPALRVAVARAVPRPELVKPLADVEREAVESAMILCGGNREQARRVLRISRAKLFRKLRTYRAQDNLPGECGHA